MEKLCVVTYKKANTNMPAFPRFSHGLLGKGTKIAFSILGKPANLSEKKTEKQKEIDKQLLVWSTSRVR